MRVARVVFLVFLLVTAFCCGCQGPSDQPAGAKKTAKPATAAAPAVSPEKPVDGGRIVIASIGEPSNLIPPLSTDSASSEVANLLYVAPLRYDKDIKLECWAAERYEVDEDGKLLKFWLKPGIRWTDGVELTAADVEFTYKLMIDPKTPTAYAGDYKAIKSFTVTGKYSFEVRYAEPFARSLVTWALAILPEHVLKGQDLMNTKYAREPVGAGPYKLVSWEPGRRLVLDANPDYFEGRPHIDQVVYRIIPDTATMFLELKAGGVDMMGLTPQQYLYQTKGPRWEADWRKFKYLSFAYTYLAYNLKSPFFSDVRVRQAFAHAVNKEDVVKGAVLGLGMPTVGPYKPGTWVYDTSITDYAYDPALAKKMLAEAGWKDRNGDGVLEDASGRPFRFTILTNQGNDQRIKSATIIQSELAAIGVKVSIRTVEWASFIKEFVNKGNFDALILGWTITQDPDAYDVWHSSRAVPGGLNFVGFKNAKADALLEEGRHTVDMAKRKKIYDAFQEILHREQPYLFLYAPYALPILSSRFQNVAVAPAGITYNFTKWWVPRDKQTFRLEK
ncbi:extracellular solute-binding protein family 5 [Solidesulfovibrio fructosivorans JJ]]|uniref:Extracellular solute-binding protein family 5 n=1 Tax=Solidesulfovibrio fructosivorans JJ] TaxID=596151 RepID=E1K0P3_SOLFR|nr:peptide-binding protein [Solidesulfovibrio fructosivorans]EFL49807.1 extracellular solute-binding protein family 5 [Solidesulfovibrio fructosivorans JJ]]